MCNASERPLSGGKLRRAEAVEKSISTIGSTESGVASGGGGRGGGGGGKCDVQLPKYPKFPPLSALRMA